MIFINSKLIWLKYDVKLDKLINVNPTYNCIAILDSGVGGLSIVNYLAKLNPFLTFMFYKDSDNFPYGNKDKETLINIGLNCIDKIKKYNPKMLCIACNTLCCALKDYTFSFKVIKINELIVKQCKDHLKTGKHILVLSTLFTKESLFYQSSLKDYKLTIKDCNKLVKQIESNKIDKQYVLNLVSDDTYDAIILGCTHFNYIHDLIDKNGLIFDGLSYLLQEINY